MFIPRQPHPLVHVGERYNSSPLLRQSDWPRLLKMDLEHLPFIAFPLPLPDVTAEHDFPRKKKKLLLPFPTWRTMERRQGCCFLQARPVLFHHTGYYYLFFFFLRFLQM